MKSFDRGGLNDSQCNRLDVLYKTSSILAAGKAELVFVLNFNFKTIKSNELNMVLTLPKLKDIMLLTITKSSQLLLFFPTFPANICC